MPEKTKAPHLASADAAGLIPADGETAFAGKP